MEGGKTTSDTEDSGKQAPVTKETENWEYQTNPCHGFTKERRRVGLRLPSGG